MNKKDFQKYMKQGLGRCALILQSAEHIEPYKEIVLWGCLRNLSYDTQCEGTRASYLYRLTTYFDDEDYFLTPCIEAFEKIPRRSDWLFAHFTELLGKFAENGNTRSKNALNQKYERLLSVLLKKRNFSAYDFERDNFERVCITLCSIGGTETLLKTVNDMGCLFRENPHYNIDDFDWFCSATDDGIGEKRFNAILSRESKKSENIRCFYQNYLKSTEAAQNIVRKPIKTPSTEDKIKLAEEAIAEVNLDVKAELLSAFSFRNENFPLSHERMIEYSKSSHERLREVAFDVLTNCQSEAVQKYALSLLADEKAGSTHPITDCLNLCSVHLGFAQFPMKAEYKAYALKMLLCNYSSDIKNLLLAELYKIKVDCKDESDWHSIGLKILNVRDQKVRLPKEFFNYIYETTLCSCCREYAIRALAKNRWLTREMIEECRYDSNSNITAYVNRYYPLKHSGNTSFALKLDKSK